VEDEDGEVVKTYELPPSKTAQAGQPGPVRKELTRMTTWTGLKKPDEPSKAAASSSEAPESSGVRQGLSRMGTWGFGGKNTNKEDAIPGQEDAEDDRHIRFTIGGAGRRLTKEDFLKEIQSLDPKARCEVISESDAPAAMKDLAQKDASDDSPGSSRLFGAKNPQRASGKGVAKTVGAAMARARGADLRGEDDEGYGRDHESGSESESDRERKKRAKGALDLRKKRERAESIGGRTLSKIESHMSGEQPETDAERKRREQALKGVDDVTDAQRGRSRTLEEEHRVGGSASASASGSGSGSRGPEVGETPAERRRREAALGVSGGAVEEDSDDDDTPRVPPPVAKSRGIRFAQSPVRGRK